MQDVTGPPWTVTQQVPRECQCPRSLAAQREGLNTEGSVLPPPSGASPLLPTLKPQLARGAELARLRSVNSTPRAYRGSPGRGRAGTPALASASVRWDGTGDAAGMGPASASSGGGQHPAAAGALRVATSAPRMPDTARDAPREGGRSPLGPQCGDCMEQIIGA